MKHIRNNILIFFTLFLLTATQAVWAETLRVDITGLTGDVLKNVQERLSIVQEGYGNPLTVNKIQTFYQHAPTDIRNAIEPYGFFKSHISPSLSLLALECQEN